jgi:NADH dehydrogenase
LDGANAVLSPMSKASQEEIRWKALKIRCRGKIKLTTVRIMMTPCILQMEKAPFKPKKRRNLGPRGVLQKFSKNSESYGAENEWLLMPSTRVNATENIYAIGDTCIQLTDTYFPNVVFTRKWLRVAVFNKELLIWPNNF